MTITQQQLSNTFLEHIIRTNSLITIANELTEGNLLTTGTISISNGSGFQNNVSLNVRSGMIYGDGGLLSNVGKPGSIINQKLQNSTFNLVVGPQFTLTNSIVALGSTLYLNVATLSTSNNDTSTSNIASANLVNAVHSIARRAEINASKAYDKANSANIFAYSAYELANTTNTLAVGTAASISSFGTAISKTSVNASAAFAKANAANLLAFGTGLGANAFSAATIAGANSYLLATIAGANTRVGSGANAFAAATIAGANAFFTATMDGANTFFIETIDGANAFFTATMNGANTVSIGAYDRANTYILQNYVSGNPPSAAQLYMHAAPFAFTLPASLTGSYVIANNRPSGAIAFTITKNGTNVGTVNFTGGASGAAESGTFTVASTISMAAGDILGIRNTAGAQTQLMNIMFSLVGTRT